MKPSWIKKRLANTNEYYHVRQLLKNHNLNTVCESADCPNKAECFSKKTATFMILGDVCTRNCKYCNIKTGKACDVDEKEPERIAEAVSIMGLKHVVITSVTRDDLEDGGAGHFVNTVLAIKTKNNCSIEVLIPDFIDEDLKKVVDCGVDVLNHNIEVTKRLFSDIRAQGDYEKSLEVLRQAKKMRSDVITKSGFMVGLGESFDEVKKTIEDLSFVDVITIGQYLQPSKYNLEVEKYYTPEEFKEIENFCHSCGIKVALCGPFVRSSYNAQTVKDIYHHKKLKFEHG